MKVKFFMDRYPNMNEVYGSFTHESLANSFKKSPEAKRIWIEVNIPDDRQLWPDSFVGVSAEVLDVKVQL